MKKVVLALAVLGIGLFACKGKEKSSEEGIKRASASGEKTLVIDFNSKGSGINHAAFNAVDSVLKDTGALGCTFTNNLVKYGREGERQFCLSFSDQRCFNKVYGAVSAIAGESANVKIVPNGKCRK